MTRPPWTFWFGALLIAACEVLLFIDVTRRGWLVIPTSPGDVWPEPVGKLGWTARWVAANMTVLCWIGYLLFFDGLIERLRRRSVIRNPQSAISSPLRARPHRFLLAWLTSIPLWCFFDWVNFYFMDAWRYHGLPVFFVDRLVGYFIAFAAISPGMFLAAELYQRLGLWRLQTMDGRVNRRVTWSLIAGVSSLLILIALCLEAGQHRVGAIPLPAWVGAVILLLPPALVFIWRRCPYATAFTLGAGCMIWAVIVADPVGNLTLWIGLIFLLDPVNHALGAPSIIGDWLAGRWGRWVALMAGGATCGFCWEFWNYWAIAKWTYHLPFLGRWEHYRYFEMPWLGFLGFLPFAVECWVVLNTIQALLERANLRIAEPLSDSYGVF